MEEKGIVARACLPPEPRCLLLRGTQLSAMILYRNYIILFRYRAPGVRKRQQSLLLHAAVHAGLQGVNADWLLCYVPQGVNADWLLCYVPQGVTVIGSYVTSLRE